MGYRLVMALHRMDGEAPLESLVVVDILQVVERIVEEDTAEIVEMVLGSVEIENLEVSNRVVEDKAAGKLP
jgi:hypothetical protein